MLTPYIKDLLYRYDKVIIPNFGGFISNKISAQIDEDNHTFYPPKKELAFNSNLKENDDLLAEYIVSKDHITKEAAQNFINFQIDDWFKKLEKEPLTLEGIGIFIKDTQGKLQFLPDETSNFLADSFGLAQIKKSQVKRTTTSEISDEKIQKTPLKTEQKERKKRKLGWLRYVAFIALFIILASLLYEFFLHDYFTKDKYHNEPQNNAIEIEKPNRTLELNSEHITDENTTENIIDTLPNNNTHTDKETENSTIETLKPNTYVLTHEYYIIVGAFGETINAQKKLNQLKTDGFQNALIVDSPHSRLIHVACGPYSSMKNSRSDLNLLQQKNPQAWVLKK